MRAWLIALLLWSMAALADPVDDWIAAQPEKYQHVLGRISGNDRLMSYTAACPADVLRGQRARPSGDKSCTAAPGWCLSECLFGNGDACFGVARMIETELDTVGAATLKFPMFMAACADGNANGCTNAGASAKNGSWLGERPALAASADCQFRTYDAACKARAPWGCFMLGLEWSERGVDGATDDAKARAAWERSCTLAPEGSACAAARPRLN